MQKGRRNAINSLRSAKVLSNLSKSVPTGVLVQSDPKFSASLSTFESKRADAQDNLIAIDTQSRLNEPFDPSLRQCEQDSDLLKLKYELERVRSHVRSIQKENEILRGLLASEPTRPAINFRRAILMRIYPDEVVNAIGVHSGHDAMFVAVQATLFNSKSLPIQKVSTSFSDGLWQEEMTFILDTECRWMEGRLVLELKQQMFASTDEPIISTASFSLSRCLDWLQEGGEHCVQIQMEQTSAAQIDESTRTMLFLTVKVAAERMSSDQTLNFEAPQKERTIVQQDDKLFSKANEPVNSTTCEIYEADSAALPGIPDESGLASVATADPCLSDSTQQISVNSNAANNEPASSFVGAGIERATNHVETVAKRVTLMTRWKKNALKRNVTPAVDESARAASCSDEEEQDTADAIKTISSSTSSSRRLELAPNSNRSSSAEFVDSRASLSSLKSLIFERKTSSSKITLATVRDDSQKRAQIKMLNSLHSNIAIQNADKHKNITSDTPLELTLENEALHSTSEVEVAEGTRKPADESNNMETGETGIDPNFVAAIKGVSFANQRLLSIIKKNRDSKSNVPSDPIDTTHNSDSSTQLVQPFQLESAQSVEVLKEPHEEIIPNPARRCLTALGTSFKLWFAAAQRPLKKFFAQFQIRKRVATVQPLREVLDVEAEVDAMNLAEERRMKFQNSRAAAKKLIEELETTEDEVAPSKPDQEREDDSIESKLLVAISVLKVAVFDMPNRAVKITPVTAIVQVMKPLSTGNSTAHQRLIAIQNYLQSKWIDCQSLSQIMSWIKSPSEEVRFFEYISMRVLDKKGLARVASKFIYTAGTKFVALKTVERLIALSQKTVLCRAQRKAQLASDKDDLPEEEEIEEEEGIFN